MQELKKCSKCGKVKKLVEFSIDRRNKKNGRQSRCKDCNKNYYNSNRDKIINSSKATYYTDHDETLERRRKLRGRPGEKIKKARTDRAHYIKNSKWFNVNSAHIINYWKSWYFNPLIKEKLKKNGNNTLTLAQVEKLFNRHPYCAYCGKFNIKLILDHIVPINRGGQNCIGNINIACEYCNSAKGDKLLEEWLGKE